MSLFIAFIGVLRHMIVQADWRRSCTFGRAPNAIDISKGSLTCPSYTDTGPPFLYGDSDTPLHLVAFYDTPIELLSIILETTNQTSKKAYQNNQSLEVCRWILLVDKHITP